MAGTGGWNRLNFAYIERRIFRPDEPDWRMMLLELRERGISCRAIANLASVEPSTIRWLIAGSAKKRHTKRPRWRTGEIIIAAHKAFCRGGKS